MIFFNNRINERMRRLVFVPQKTRTFAALNLG